MAFSRAEKEKRAAFEEWALPHMNYVYTASLYLTHDRQEAEDLFQETYLKAYRFFYQFTVGTNCRAWLLTILHNTFKNRYRERLRAQRQVNLDTVLHEYENMVATREDGTQSNPEAAFFARLLDHEVEEALKSLPDDYRMAVLLVDIEDLSYEEAARVLECPIGTIRSRLSRGRRLLQLALNQYAKERGYIK